jgi:REP element-mobilizing transposase RayT
MQHTRRTCVFLMHVHCYFAGACGGAPLSVIRKYIEQQQSPEI